MDISQLGSTAITRLRALMKKLRDPETGCPWDLKQSFETIAPYTIEEAYEVAEAIERKNMPELREELGDLLFQVIFYAQLAEEQRLFTFDEICDGLTEKMVKRHPHVFGETANSNLEHGASPQPQKWEEIKKQEREKKAKDNNQTFSLLDDVPLALPALTRAEKLQKRAARVGFDWPDLTGVTDKISEEAKELAEASSDMDADAIEDEMGDLLFAVTNLARKLNVDPEKALRRTNSKFCKRFSYIENIAQQDEASLEDMSLDEMENLWQQAKSKLNN